MDVRKTFIWAQSWAPSQRPWMSCRAGNLAPDNAHSYENIDIINAHYFQIAEFDICSGLSVFKEHCLENT